jgi:long-chain acyl-CoA synthetase
MGETPLALVVLEEGTSAMADKIQFWCNERLGAQRLSEVEVRPELPKNAIGKVLKRDLRDAFWRAPGLHDCRPE